MDTSKKMILLCGVNGTGKSTVATKFKNDGYTIVDVDKSNFDTKSKKKAYRTHFNKYLIKKLSGTSADIIQLNQEDFDKIFDQFFEGECNKDASLTLLTMFEKITDSDKTTGVDREYAIDELYKSVLAPVYRADTIINLRAYKDSILQRIRSENEDFSEEEIFAETSRELAKPICIDVGSRKFFFVDDSFIKELELMGYKPEIIYMNLDIEKNLNNLFSIRDGKYVISERLNLTAVTKTYIENLISSGINEVSGVSLSKLASGITSNDKEIWNESYKLLTQLSEENVYLKYGIREAIREYMLVRQNTLGRQLEELLDGERSKMVHKIDIFMEDNPNTIYEKMKDVLFMRSVVSEFVAPITFAPKSILFEFSDSQEMFDSFEDVVEAKIDERSVEIKRDSSVPIFDIDKYKRKTPEFGKFTRKFASRSFSNSSEISLI